MVGGAAHRKHLDRYLRSPAGTPVVQVEMQAHAGIGEQRQVCRRTTKRLCYRIEQNSIEKESIEQNRMEQNSYYHDIVIFSLFKFVEGVISSGSNNRPVGTIMYVVKIECLGLLKSKSLNAHVSLLKNVFEITQIKG